MVPTEREVAVGPVELGEVGEHPRVGDHLPGAVGALEGAFHPPVEHGPIPARQLRARDGAGPVRPAPRAIGGIDGVGVVVCVPQRDRRVVAERVDRRAGLGDRLFTNRSRMATDQREVLEQQQAELVGGVVHLAIGDVAVYPQCIEAEFDRGGEIAPDALGRGIGGQRVDRQEVGPLEEDPFAVDAARPVVPRDLPEPGASPAAIARLAVDEYVHVDVDEGLVTERPWPPQRGIDDVDVPLDLVLARRHDELLLVRVVPVDRGEHGDGDLAIAVEPSGDAQVGPPIVGIATQHSQPVDADRAGVEPTNRAPQSARVEVRPGRRLERACDVPASRDRSLRCTRELHREDVVVGEARQRRDVEGVGKEVPLGIAEVRTVEPHVGLVEDSVERDPAPPA